MANSKATTTTIPLNGELCLSKKQLDITQFKGWDRVNGPIYGECLSPLYKTTDDTKHDYWESNGAYYNINTDNGITLSKNGSTVFSTDNSKGFTKERFDSYWDSIDHGNIYACIRKNGNNSYSYTTNTQYPTEPTESGTVDGSIRKVKARIKGRSFIFAIVYTTLIDDVEHYYLKIISNNYGTATKELAIATMIDPNIQIAMNEIDSQSVPAISVYSNWGDSISAMEVDSFVYNTNGWINITKFKHVEKPEDVDKPHGIRTPDYVDVKLSISTIESWSTSIVTGGQYNSIVVKTESSGNEEQWLDCILSKIPEGMTNPQIWIQYKREQYSSDGTIVETTGGKYQVGSYKGYVIKRWDYIDGIGHRPKYAYRGSPNLQEVSDTKMSIGIRSSYSLYEAGKQPVINNGESGLLFSPGERRVNNTNNGGGFIYSDFVFTLEEDNLVYRIPAEKVNYSYEYRGNGGQYTDLSTNSVTPGTYRMTTYSVNGEIPGIIKDVDAFMDDGFLYSVTPVSNSILGAGGIIPTGTVVLRGELHSIESAQINYNVKNYIIFHYAAEDNIETEGIPKYYKGYAVNLGQGFIRNCYSFTAKEDTDADYLYLMYDNIINELLFQPGVLSGTCVNFQGSRVSGINGTNFNILYNENSPSGISYSEEKDTIGTLVSDWAKIDSTFDVYAYSDNDGQYCVYRDTNGITWKISYTDNIDWTWKLLEDRFFVFNTGSYFNCYDIKADKKYHFASDYNNRIITGAVLKNGFVDNTDITYYSSKKDDVVLIGSGQNVNYEMNNNFPICSATFPIHIYQYALTKNIFPIAIKQPLDATEQVDLYLSLGAESTAANYFKSFTGNNTFKDANLAGAYYPNDLTYNLNLFSSIIETYTNTDMVLTEDTAYTLRYSGITPIFASAFASGIDGVKNAFVLQTMHYAISGHYIISLDYDDESTISRTETITDITGLQYLGCLPKQALFYSPMNKSIYSFTGDAIMKEMIQANKIDEITGTWYNPSTQALYLQTNVGLYIATDDFIYCVENIKETENIYFLDEGVVKIVAKIPDESEDKLVTLTLSYNPIDGANVIPLNLETKYYGLGDNKKCSISNWYLRFYNNEDLTATGTIKLSTRTLTDIGTSTDEKEYNVTAESWDSLTNSYYVKYSPKYSSSVGTQLCISSPFPVISIGCSYISDDTVALSHVNG